MPSQAPSEGKRSWLTAQEFLEQVEAHRLARLKERATPEKPNAARVIAREYQLNPHLKYDPKPKQACMPEVAP
jgi:hypothetical protein